MSCQRPDGLAQPPPTTRHWPPSPVPAPSVASSQRARASVTALVQRAASALHDDLAAAPAPPAADDATQVSPSDLLGGERTSTFAAL